MRILKILPVLYVLTALASTSLAFGDDSQAVGQAAVPATGATGQMAEPHCTSQYRQDSKLQIHYGPDGKPLDTTSTEQAS